MSKTTTTYAVTATGRRYGHQHTILVEASSKAAAKNTAGDNARSACKLEAMKLGHGELVTTLSVEAL